MGVTHAKLKTNNIGYVFGHFYYWLVCMHRPTNKIHVYHKFISIRYVCVLCMRERDRQGQGYFMSSKLKNKMLLALPTATNFECC